MPSSSERNTAEEMRLFDYFKEIYVRLFYAELQSEARTVSQIFGEALDVQPGNLITWLGADPKFLKAAKENADKRQVSDLCWSAGNYLADSAAVLFEFGRKVEGARHCEWADQLHGLALDWQDVEKKGS
ncbi:uncharacterized protein MYCFIDRAFT_78695 [Pseudocercospora fijiensis CIRAD86]|uniref:Uncharacterized protein n=1 Tax=Pseudocercospora fijiensis (strain CIRAD86) TaxID=383855 RepID=M3AXP3_PSEFD|nr:uncharacterized protein MYCFIDRAFT_78695 [Pseudocercospora fijiensis CIRAD86]EME81878.1 hypothetical protein MYCFIDRAFT_78695 [Pseudocercospora fijiensis CIRAD86]